DVVTEAHDTERTAAGTLRRLSEIVREVCRGRGAAAVTRDVDHGTGIAGTPQPAHDDLEALDVDLIEQGPEVRKVPLRDLRHAHHRMAYRRGRDRQRRSAWCAIVFDRYRQALHWIDSLEGEVGSRAHARATHPFRRQ